MIPGVRAYYYVNKNPQGERTCLLFIPFVIYIRADEDNFYIRDSESQLKRNAFNMGNFGVPNYAWGVSQRDVQKIIKSSTAGNRPAVRKIALELFAQVEQEFVTRRLR